LKRHTPSPSMIVALVALFIALGGAAYAGVTLSNNSVRSNHIVNGQVKTADLASGAVTNAKLRNNAVNSAKVRNGSLETADLSAAAQTALKGAVGPAGPAGLAGLAGAPATALWAFVRSDGTLIRGKGTTASATTNVGFVNVTFNQPVDNCIWLATTGLDSFALPPAGYATTDRNPAQPNTVFIQTRDAAGASAARDVMLGVFC